MPIPVIDLFAGPGGLGEGFSSVLDEQDQRVFDIRLSIEKDPCAHQTLKLRSFFRQFPVANIPEDYYRFVRGEIKLEELYNLYEEQAELADEEAWCGTLGTPDDTDNNGVSNEEVDLRISKALENDGNWVLIGGPPCQAYSLVGRARRQENILDESKDKRVGLYKEYLRIIAVHNPAVFVMENVKGMLSAKTEKENVFGRILSDLSDPVTACIAEGEVFSLDKQRTRYRIFSLTTVPQYDFEGNLSFKPNDFIIKAENYGIPQKRHRVILLGIREDIPNPREILERKEEITLHSVIGSLPRIRSGISKSFSHSELVKDKEGKEKIRRFYTKYEDSADSWTKLTKKHAREIDTLLQSKSKYTESLPNSIGIEYFPSEELHIDTDHLLYGWYTDPRLRGVLHHVSRKHLVQDLRRYLFSMRYTEDNGTFPRLADFKKVGKGFSPDHQNADEDIFTDRFRTQLPNIAATTITSHISKDGHYFIHYDPTQCRSFSVREAARVQTFPDNYYFCGQRTQQFHQVGNAVPPYLAKQIGEIVHNILY